MPTDGDDYGIRNECQGGARILYGYPTTCHGHMRMLHHGLSRFDAISCFDRLPRHYTFLRSVKVCYVRDVDTVYLNALFVAEDINTSYEIIEIALIINRLPNNRLQS